MRKKTLSELSLFSINIFFYKRLFVLDILNSFVNAEEDVPEHRYLEFVYGLVKALGKIIECVCERGRENLATFWSTFLRDSIRQPQPSRENSMLEKRHFFTYFNVC